MFKKSSLENLSLNITDGKHGDCKNEKESGYFFISVKDIEVNGINYENARQITEDDFNETHKRTKLAVGDTLLANSGHTIGKMLYMKDSPYISKTTFQKSVAVLKPNQSVIDACYYHYLLKANVNGLRKAAVGSAQPNLLLGDLRNFKINYIEDISKQKKISSVLSSLDAKIELNNRINTELEVMAKTLYDYWFVQFDFPTSAEYATSVGKPNLQGKPYKSSGGKMVYNAALNRKIPEGWTNGELKDIANITMGQSPPGDSYNEDGVGTVFYQGCTDFGLRFPTNRKFTTQPSRYAKEGDILLSVRAPVGTMNIANEDCCIGRGLASLNSKDDCIGYLDGVLKYMKQIFDRRNSDGTTFGSITKDDLFSLAVVKPDKTVLKRFDSIVRPMFKKQNQIGVENQQLASLRDWLLPMLMNGQVTVQEAEEKLEDLGMVAEPESEYKRNRK